MEHDEYKDWVDVDKEIAYLIEHADCTREEASALVEGEMRYVEASCYEDSLEIFVDEPNGLNLTQFVEAAVWSIEIEAAQACTYDGKPIFADCFVSSFIAKEADLDLSFGRSAELIQAQFPLLWDDEAEKSLIRHRFSKAHEGECMYFGRDTFEEGDPYRNLWWDVLEVAEDRVLLVSHFVIDCRPYNETIPDDPNDIPFDDDFFEDANYNDEAFNAWVKECEAYAPLTWETSDLRAWLNGEFFERAFNDWEQSAILETVVDNPTMCYAEGGIASKEGSSTSDKVFCLSAEEVGKYYELAHLTRCKPTERAVAKGVEWSNDDMFAHDPDVVLDGRSETACWWTRTMGLDGDKAVYVGIEGGRDPKGASVDSRTIGVRPAIWVVAEGEKEEEE